MSSQELVPAGSHTLVINEPDTTRAGGLRRKDGRVNARAPLAERLWGRVLKTEGCWLWQGKMGENGYGRLLDGHRSHMVHRMAYELVVGPIPEGAVLDHLCRNRACVNPAHLEIVSQRTNILRGQGAGALMARRQTCSQGHPYDAQNSYIFRGYRICRACHAAAKRRWRIAKRQKEQQS